MVKKTALNSRKFSGRQDHDSKASRVLFGIAGTHKYPVPSPSAYLLVIVGYVCVHGQVGDGGNNPTLTLHTHENFESTILIFFLCMEKRKIVARRNPVHSGLPK